MDFQCTRFHSLAISSVLLLVLFTACQSQSHTPPPKASLKAAIENGLKPDGDLEFELQKLGEYQLVSSDDVQAICQALTKLLDESATPVDNTSTLYRLAVIIGQTEPTSPTYLQIKEKAWPLLIKNYDQALTISNADTDQLLYILRLLACDGSKQTAEKVLEATRLPLAPNAIWWLDLLEVFNANHPQKDYFFSEVQDSLPPGIIGIAVLDQATRLADQNELSNHPFDCENGILQLQDWLQPNLTQQSSFAQSATSVLPYISQPAREELLNLAMKYPLPKIRIQAAKLAADDGIPAGLQTLTEACLDVNVSQDAQQALRELQKADLIPPQVSEPEFQARTEFANWLSAPNPSGNPADQIEIVEQRTFAWPPDNASRNVWIVQARTRDRSGLEPDVLYRGLVGTVTECFFSDGMEQRPPDDVYAIHCGWEMEESQLVQFTEADGNESQPAPPKQWQGQQVQSATLSLIAQISPRLKTASQTLALFSASVGSQPGWFVMDGSQVTWYPESEQPQYTSSTTVLRLHLGRLLLGIQQQPDRANYLQTAKNQISPLQFVAAYERLIDELPEASLERRREIIENAGFLDRHFETYVANAAEIRQASREKISVETYQRIVNQVADWEPEQQVVAFDGLGLLGEQFESVVDELIRNNQPSVVQDLVQTFLPHWQNNLGYQRLGNAAFQAGDRKTAEPLLEQLHKDKGKLKAPEIGMLAEIWIDNGKRGDAKDLLLGSLISLIDEYESTQYDSDRENSRQQFQAQRAIYLRLFPNQENELAKHGIAKELN